MNTERILNQFKKHYNKGGGTRSSPKEARELIKKYQSIPLTLPIGDEPMKRVCEVLTRAGYETLGSCEGHGKELPKIFLKCASQYHLRHLTSILCREARETTFPWDLRTWTGEVFVNPLRSLSYIVQPGLYWSNTEVTKPKVYQDLIDDLDIIGICVLRYFSSVNLKDLERDRKRIDDLAKGFKNPQLPEDFFRK